MLERVSSIDEQKEKLEGQVRDAREEVESTQNKFKAAAVQFEADMKQLAEQHRELLESSQVTAFTLVFLFIGKALNLLLRTV